MCEGQRVASYAVMRHEDPARQPLIQVCSRVGDGGMRRLYHEDLHVFEQQCVQSAARAHRLAQLGSCDLLSLAGSLDVGVVRRLFAAQHDGRSAHSLAADEADFDALVAIVDRNHRRESGLHEEDRRNRPVWPLKVAFDGKHSAPQVRLQQRTVGFRQRGEKQITRGGGRYRKHARCFP